MKKETNGFDRVVKWLGCSKRGELYAMLIIWPLLMLLGFFVYRSAPDEDILFFLRLFALFPFLYVGACAFVHTVLWACARKTLPVRWLCCVLLLGAVLTASFGLNQLVPGWTFYLLIDMALVALFMGAFVLGYVMDCFAKARGLRIRFVAYCAAAAALLSADWAHPFLLEGYTTGSYPARLGAYVYWLCVFLLAFGLIFLLQQYLRGRRKRKRR